MIDVLFAGTPSSGLERLCSRFSGHPGVLVTRDAGLFSHAVLWDGAGEDWRSKYRSFFFGQSRPAFPASSPLASPFEHHAMMQMGLDSGIFRALIDGGENGAALVSAVRRQMDAICGAVIWIDASHANLHAANAFLSAIEAGRVLLTVRRGGDHIAALVDAGFGFKEAARLWFAESALIRVLSERWPARVRVVSFDELLREDADRVTASIGEWLGAAPSGRCLAAAEVAEKPAGFRLEERHLNYIAGLKLDPAFSKLVGDLPAPEWRGGDMLVWTGEPPDDERRAREDLDENEKAFHTTRGSLMSPFVKFAPWKEKSEPKAENKKERAATGLRRFFGLKPDAPKEPAGGAKIADSPEERGRFGPGREAGMAVRAPSAWVPPEATVPDGVFADMACVISHNASADIITATVRSVLRGAASPAQTPTMIVVLVAGDEAGWLQGCELQREDARVIPVAATAREAGARWQAGVDAARRARPSAVLLLEAGEIAGPDFCRRVWWLLNHGNPTEGRPGFEMVGAGVWTARDCDPASDHSGREWSASLSGKATHHGRALGKVLSHPLLERMEWRLFDERHMVEDAALEHVWRRAVDAHEAHFHLMQDPTLISDVRGHRCGDGEALTLVPHDFQFCGERRDF